MGERDDQLDTVGKTHRLFWPYIIGVLALLGISSLMEDWPRAAAGEPGAWAQVGTGGAVLVILAGYGLMFLDQRLEERPWARWLPLLILAAWSAWALLDGGLVRLAWLAAGAAAYVAVLTAADWLYRRWKASRPKRVRAFPWE